MMNRTDLIILATLLNQQADKFMVAMSIDELMESGVDGVSRMTVYTHLRHLFIKGTVAKGAKENRAECYYITDVGKRILEVEGKVIEDD